VRNHALGVPKDLDRRIAAPVRRRREVAERARLLPQQVVINLLAPIQLTRAVLPSMLARNSGVIVMISSMSGKGPTPYNAVYAATKYGLNGFTSSLRIELKDSGVHVGVVCPGFVAGGMWASTGLKAPSSMKEVSTADVCAGVRQVISGANEVLVTSGPMRPALAFAQLFPSLEARAMGWMGITKTLQERADVTKSKRLGSR
jgi:short-subunit dehydrogenase